MNNGFVRWLLDIDRLPEDASGVHLAWAHAWPAWVWLLMLLLLAAFAFWSYSRLLGSPSGRRTLAVIRTLILLLVVIIIAGPLLQLERDTVEEDWVLLLADRSQSLGIADAGSDNAAAGVRISRDRQLREIIDNSESAWSELNDNHHVVWLGFHDGVFDLSTPAADLAPPGEPVVVLGEPDGAATNLNTSLEQALQRAAARPISGIVIFSDGRTTDPPVRSLIRRLQADKIGVYVVPLGSDEPLGDLAVARVDAPRRAFVRDKVPVTVELERFGEAVRTLGGTARLIDQDTGEVLDEIEISPGSNDETITLIAEPELAGETTWVVQIVTDRADLVPENNTKSFAIELVDRPLRVLYIEGYPRWEYHYLKWILIREKSIESSIILLSADRNFAQEGNTPLTRLPRSPEEFAEFDVIVLGDIPGTFFSPSQLEMIRAHVAERGAGLLWIAGERWTPGSYVGTAGALADVLPIRGSLALPRIDEPVNMTPTEYAERLGVLRLVTAGDVGWPKELVDPSYRWSRLWWAQRIPSSQLKPTARALAVTTTEFDGEPLPLVIHMRYGSGQTIYVATDEIWRWRYGRGDFLPEQFWVQMLRMLGRDKLAGGDDPAVLTVEPRRLAVGQPMLMRLRLLDSRLVDLNLAKVRASLIDEDAVVIADLELRRDENAPSDFLTTWLPDVTGKLRVRIDDPLVAAQPLVAEVEVYSPDDELRRPETDHALLAALAEDTGGAVLAPDEVDRLPGLLPNRSIKTANPLTERIWDTPLAFILVLLLLTGEWIGRKLLRLA